MIIRPFTPDDYPIVTLLGNLNFPDHLDTIEEIRWGDEHRDPKHKWARFVGEVDSHPAAIGEYGQGSGMFHPRKLSIMIMVHPDKQGQGVGKAMYEHVMEATTPFNLLSVRSFARESMPRTVKFLEDRGFVEDMRYWESALNVPAFDFAAFDGAEEKPLAHGITTQTVAELQKTDPNWVFHLYELSQAVQRDIPRPEPFTPTAFEIWEKRLHNPNFLPDAQFIALDGAKYVGLSTLSKGQADSNMHTGITGVLPDYRRKGIALALKLKAVRYAKNANAPVIRTGNETGNRPMLAINEAMGFERMPAWIDYVKVLQTEETGE